MCNRKAAHDAIRAELWSLLQLTREVVPPAPVGASPLEQLLFDTAREHFMAVAQLVGDCRLPCQVDARRCFAVKAREMGYSYPVIGRMLHKHHSSVIHMVRKQNGSGCHAEAAG